MLVVGDVVEPVIAQPALKDTTAFDPSRSAPTWMVLALVACILLLYAYPYWMVYARLGAGPAPPIFAADLNFYIAVSHMAAPVGGLMHNGWYGVDVPTAQFAYGRFHLALSAYALLRSIVRGETATLVLWMLAGTALICAAALWLMRQAFPKSTTILLLFALTLLLLVDFDYAYLVLLKLLKVCPWSATSGLMPPFIRAFSPQVSIPPGAGLSWPANHCFARRPDEIRLVRLACDGAPPVSRLVFPPVRNGCPGSNHRCGAVVTPGGSNSRLVSAICGFRRHLCYGGSRLAAVFRWSVAGGQPRIVVDRAGSRVSQADVIQQDLADIIVRHRRSRRSMSPRSTQGKPVDSGCLWGCRFSLEPC